MKRVAIWSLVVVSASTGCGKKVAEIAAEKAIEYSAQADGKDVKVDFQSDGGTMTMKVDGSDVTMTTDADNQSMVIESKEGSFVTGENVAIPENFPKDVPVHKGLKPTTSSTMGDEGTFMLSGTLDGSMEDVAAFYTREAAANGWTETMKLSQPQMTMLTYEKDDRSLSIMAASESGSASLSITVAKK